MTDIVGDGWWQDLDISGNIPKQAMIQEAQAWLDDQGYSVQVLNVRLNDDDTDWFIEGSFNNPNFAKKGMAEGDTTKKLSGATPAPAPNPYLKDILIRHIDEVRHFVQTGYIDPTRPLFQEIYEYFANEIPESVRRSPGRLMRRIGDMIAPYAKFYAGTQNMNEQGVAEGIEEDPLDLGSDYALYIADAGRKMMTQLTNLAKKIQTDSTAAQNAKRWNLGDYMHQHYKTDDMGAINQVFEEYGVGGFFGQNLYKLLASWSSQGPKYVTTWKQYSGDVIMNSNRKPGAQSVHEQGVAEGNDDHIWGPQGNFAGDRPVNIGGAVSKRLDVNDTVSYFGEKATILAMSKDRTVSRIHLKRGTTQNVRTSDLKRVERGMAEGEVIPFARKQLTWQQLPKDVLKLANDWFWADDDDSSLAAVLDPKGYGSGTRNDVQYIAAQLQQRGWTIDHDLEDNRPDEFNLKLTNKRGQSVLLPWDDARNFTGWAAGTRPSMQEDNRNLYRRPTAGEANRTAQQTQAKLNPTASKFVWKRPNQIGGSFKEQDLLAKGFKKSQYNSWGGTQAMWNRLTTVGEQLDRPTPTAQQILDKHNLSVEDFIAQLRLGVKVELEHTKDAKIAYEIALDHLNERPDYYTVLARTGLEEAASGYIPTEAEKDDPRFKTALTVDVRPGTDKKNMRALRLIK
jgi:hypothetical protein